MPLTSLPPAALGARAGGCLGAVAGLAAIVTPCHSAPGKQGAHPAPRQGTGGSGARIWLFACMKETTEAKSLLLSWREARRWRHTPEMGESWCSGRATRMLLGRRGGEGSPTVPPAASSLLLLLTLTGIRIEDPSNATPAPVRTDGTSQSFTHSPRDPQGHRSRPGSWGGADASVEWE